MNFLIAKIFTAVTISMAGVAFAYDAYNAPGALPVTPPVTVSLAPLPTAPTTTQAPLTDCQYALQLAQQAGWPLTEMGTVARIIYRESGCKADAYNGKENSVEHRCLNTNIRHFACTSPEETFFLRWLSIE